VRLYRARVFKDVVRGFSLVLQNEGVLRMTERGIASLSCCHCEPTKWAWQSHLKVIITATGLITILMSMPCHGKMAVHLPIRVIRYTILQNSIEN
jgi:hypothetical protein